MSTQTEITRLKSQLSGSTTRMRQDWRFDTFASISDAARFLGSEFLDLFPFLGKGEYKIYIGNWNDGRTRLIR